MRIKFLTLNIYHGGIFWDNLFDFLKTTDVDILCLQEVYDGKDSSLEKRFRALKVFQNLFQSKLPFSVFEPTVLDTGKDNIPWGNAIFSKFPLENSRPVFFDMPLTRYDFQTDPDPRNAAEGMVVTDVQISGEIVTIASWHGVWNNHGEETPQRKIMEGKIIQSLRDSKKIILAGDTNINPTTDIVENIESELNLKSVFGTSLTSTFNMRHKKSPSYATAAVDMIFVSKEIKVIDKKLVDVDVSDHYPLFAELEI